jgi:hypothetical protein
MPIVLSLAEAAVTITARSRPRVSVMMPRLRPTILLPLCRHRHKGSYLEWLVMPGRPLRSWCRGGRPGITTGFQEGQERVGRAVAFRVLAVGRCPGQGFLFQGQVGVEVDVGRFRAGVYRVGCAARSGFTWCEFRPFPRSLPPNPAGAF